MAVYRIAGLYVRLEPRYEHLRAYAEKYLCDEPVDSEVIEIENSEKGVIELQKSNPHLSLAESEYIWCGWEFGLKLLRKNGFMIHSSAVVYDGSAYLFSADSGVGKSTHTAYWQKVFGSDKAVVINDDKPAVREIDGVYYAAGSPFSGKSDLNENVMAPVKALCFIYRSEKNEITRLTVSEALDLVFDQMIRPRKEENLALMLELLDGFLSRVPVYKLGVTHSPEAARFAYEEINRA